ncbi:MAG: DUF1501 domain-containing protein [Verrucomicrobiales bacterium]|nr:DUF1501 domain-containing protein [Verrucomicrobiales bacterium]
MHIHDWHATILHLLGLDHERLFRKEVCLIMVDF